MIVDPELIRIRNEFRFRRIFYVPNKVGMELQSDTSHSGDGRLLGAGLSNANWIEHWDGTNCVSGEQSDSQSRAL